MYDDKAWEPGFIPSHHVVQGSAHPFNKLIFTWKLPLSLLSSLTQNQFLRNMPGFPSYLVGLPPEDCMRLSVCQCESLLESTCEIHTYYDRQTQTFPDLACSCLLGFVSKQLFLGITVLFGVLCLCKESWIMFCFLSQVFLNLNYMCWHTNTKWKSKQNQLAMLCTKAASYILKYKRQTQTAKLVASLCAHCFCHWIKLLHFLLHT